jgi:hypothetical protein
MDGAARLGGKRLDVWPNWKEQPPTESSANGRGKR